MKSNYIKYFLSLLVILLVTWTISCSGKSGKSTGKPEAVALSADVAAVRLIKMVSPEENSEFRLGDNIIIRIELENEGRIPDSISLFFDGKKVTKITSAPWNTTIPSSFNITTGRRSVKAVAFKNGKAETTITRFIIILSDKPPVMYGYKVVHTYAHDREAFTQGLLFDNGVLYEGTGQEQGSSLREVELATGNIIRQLNLKSDLFGEGIALYKERIYQVTWTSRVGFIYEKATFNLINKIYYQTQGWGLTTIGDQIVMSDGSNNLYFMEPEMFTVVSRLEVYDNEKKVDQLNELEYINGEIWANIWMTDLIARIDPWSGKVNGYINLAGIINDQDIDHDKGEVLNGIAFDKEGKRVFVTGKRWPKLFEIRVTE
jgi:glutaminyl-peptide cyclotransferase